MSDWTIENSDSKVKNYYYQLSQQLRDKEAKKFYSIPLAQWDLPDFEKDFEYRTFNSRKDLEHHMYLNGPAICSIEKDTRGQSKNPKWFKMRGTRITASKFAHVLKKRNCNHLLFGQGTGSIAYNNDAMKWGIEHEDDGIKEYMKQKGYTEDMIVRPGILMESSGILGGSPDGIVKGKNIMIEVKCPYTNGKNKVKDWHEFIAKQRYPPFWLKKAVDGSYCINRNLDQGDSIYHQIQGNMWIMSQLFKTKDISCDLVVHNPYHTLVIPVSYDRNWAVYAEELKKIYRRQVMGHIVSEKIPMVSNIFSFFLFLGW